MIVVFVVDTSPSMGLPLAREGSSMSRLDLAKMMVEDLSRKLVRQRQVHTRALQQQQSNDQQRSYRNLGLWVGSSGGTIAASSCPGSLLLLSTSRHSPETASCAVGGRLLVGFGRSMNPHSDDNAINGTSVSSSSTGNSGTSAGAPSQSNEDVVHQRQQEAFQKALKALRAYPWNPKSNTPFPDQAGGATGLNASLSAGLQLLSRYRLQSRWTENFGLGRLPAASVLVSTSSGGTQGAAKTSSTNSVATMATVSGLQPACLVLLTDGECLSQPASLGGGSLQLQFGKGAPLKELYSEPFRWDQRVFCLNVAGKTLPSELRALCDVTGGSYWNVNKHGQLGHVTDQLLHRLLPPLPDYLPLVDPLFQRLSPILPPMVDTSAATPAHSPFPSHPPGTVTLSPAEGTYFANAGPIVAMHALEGDVDSSGMTVPPKMYRAMLLYAGSTATTLYYGSTATAAVATTSAEQDTVVPPTAANGVLSPSLWCIPEAFFPSKKAETLPPRKAQPVLLYSKYPANLGSRSFEPVQVIKMLHRLDQLSSAIRSIQVKAAGSSQSVNANTPGNRCLHRDVYICEWLGVEGGRPVQVKLKSPSPEYFPVFAQGAGRPTLMEDSDNYLHIGILHIPSMGSASLSSNANTARLATLTLLPPEPHVLLPLLLRVAEQELKLFKKMEAAGTLNGRTRVNIAIDEKLRSECRAYFFRVPVYYQPSLRWALRAFLPASLLPGPESLESIMNQNLPSACVQKIRHGEQIARDSNERLERQEASLRPIRLGDQTATRGKATRPFRYGHYDPRGTLDSYLSTLRNMPAPWKTHTSALNSKTPKTDCSDSKLDETKAASTPDDSEKARSNRPQTALDLLGDLPREGLLAFYESRRRWLFGGTGLTTRGVHVEGVNCDGGNSQRCRRFPQERQETALTLAGIGASSVNEVPVAKMGDYRERLLFSTAPIVGYGSNDCAGVAANTAVDGSPRWSVDDDAMPISFFDPATGEFTDNIHVRARARLMVNFGNPYRDKRADSLIPEKYAKAAPTSMHHHGSEDRLPPGSPPHESFDSVEEDEAVFVRKSPSRVSPRREDPEDIQTADALSPPPAKRQRSNSVDESTRKTTATPPPPPPRQSLPKRPSQDSVGLSTSKPGVPPPPPPTSDNGQGTPRKGGAQPPPPPPPVENKGQSSSQIRRPSIPPPPPPRMPKPHDDKSMISPSAPKTIVQPSLPKSNRPPPSLGTLKRQRSDSSVTTLSTAATSTLSTSPAPISPTNEELQRPDVKPSLQLPPDWMCVWSKSQKRWYFFNRRSNKSVWQWPPEM